MDISVVIGEHDGKRVVFELSAGMVVLRDEFVLLLQSKKGYWTFPSGKVKIGESLLEASLRELGEEAGIFSVTVVPNFQYLVRADTEFAHEFSQKQIHFF